MSTAPDSVTIPPQAYGVLGPIPWAIVNVQAFGAVGDGVTDDWGPFQAALDAVPDVGGIVIIPPAPVSYLIGTQLRHKSRTIIRGAGRGGKLITNSGFVSGSVSSGTTVYGGSSLFLNVNSQSDETAFSGYRDFDITFENVCIDRSADIDAGHCIFNRAVQRVRIVNCEFIGGFDGTAAVTCDDHKVIGCTSTEQTNCCYDHWGGCTDSGVYASKGRVNEDAANQVVNFNAIRTSTGSGLDEVWVSEGFVVMGCELYGRAALQRSINLETLGTNLSAAVRNVRLIGNKFHNIRIVMGGQTSGVIIEGNEFIDCDGSNPPVYGRNQNSVGPEDIVVANNIFRDCDGLGTGGLIETTGPRMMVSGNVAIGGTYDYGVRFRNDPGGYLFNDFSGAQVAPVLGTYGVVGGVQVENGAVFGMLDTTGNQARLRVDSSNSLGLIGTSSTGGARTIFSATMTSDTSSLNVFLNTTMVGYLRTGYAGGLVATGSTISDALQLAAQNNVVITTAAGTGVKLFANTGGGVSVSIYNDGANTLKVYPVNGSAEIGSLGAGVADTIAAGAGKTYLSRSVNNYRVSA